MLELTLIVGGILLRLVPHSPNFSPISAIALFGGKNINKKYSFAVLFLVMAISDYLLLYANPFGTTEMKLHPLGAMFHSTTLYVWGSFAISGLIGLWLRKRNTVSNIILASLVASVQFYVITNFGVWATGMYSRGIDGLVTSYAMGLPFFQWTLLGDLFYTGVFFGGYALAKKTQELSLDKKPLVHRINLGL
jgi:hypothetical protein